MASRLGDRHLHAVAELVAVDRLAELETGGKDLAGDQIGARPCPRHPLPRHRDRPPAPACPSGPAPSSPEPAPGVGGSPTATVSFGSGSRTRRFFALRSDDAADATSRT